MKKIVVLFTKPFGAYAKGDRAGFDADSAKNLQDIGVAKPEADPDQQEQQAAPAGAAGAETEQKLPEQVPAQSAQVEAEQAPQAADQELKPAGKASKGAKA